MSEARVPQVEFGHANADDKRQGLLGWVSCIYGDLHETLT